MLCHSSSVVCYGMWSPRRLCHFMSEETERFNGMLLHRSLCRCNVTIRLAGADNSTDADDNFVGSDADSLYLAIVGKLFLTMCTVMNSPPFYLFPVRSVLFCVRFSTYAYRCAFRFLNSIMFISRPLLATCDENISILPTYAWSHLLQQEKSKVMQYTVWLYLSLSIVEIYYGN